MEGTGRLGADRLAELIDRNEMLHFGVEVLVESARCQGLHMIEFARYDDTIQHSHGVDEPRLNDMNGAPEKGSSVAIGSDVNLVEVSFWCWA